MLRCALTALLALVCVASSVSAGQFAYSGSALPTVSGWEVYGTSSYENGGGITSAIVSDAWKLTDASTTNRCLERNVSLGDVSFDVGATCAAKIKCESATPNSSHVLGISNAGSGAMFLKLTTTQLYLVDMSGYYRGSYVLDATVYHNYHITVMNSTPGSDSTAVWRVYVDRAEVITWTGAGPDAGYDGFMAGHGGGAGTGVWYFDGVAGRNDGVYTPDQWEPFSPDPPAQPAVVVPANGALIGGSDPLIQWTASSHDRYEVHINTTNSPTGPSAWDSGEVTSSANICTGGTLANGTYYVFVRVANMGGWSTWSASGRSFTVGSGFVQPAAPNLVIPASSSATRDTTPNVQWAGESHDAYEIHMTTSDSPTGSIAWSSGIVASSADSASAGPLPYGSYYAYVRVHSAGGWSPWSQQGVNFTVSLTAKTMKQGWVLIRDEPVSYFEELLSHAPEYDVNMVQLSHSIIMYTWEVLTNPTHRDKINQIIDIAHNYGVDEVVAWVHDIQDNSRWRVPGEFKTGDGKIDLDQQAFWDWLAGTYEDFFDACPQLDGIVFTSTENFVYGGADVVDRTLTKHTNKTPEDSLLKIIQTIASVCGSRGKSLYVRNWSLYGGLDRWVRNAIIRTNNPNIWMMSKATGAGDWDSIQEPYDIIGTCTGHPELVEFDVVGEYWGYTWTPWCGVNYMRNLWTDFALPRGADGMVARIDREDHSQAPGLPPRSIEGPNRVNLYAQYALANYPTVTEDSIYDYFSTHWFGNTASDRVTSALKRSFDISNACWNLPMPSNGPDYSFSDSVARDYCLASLFDIDCVNSILKASSNFKPGTTNYDALRDPFERAAGKLGLTIPRTLFGDFTANSQANGTATVSARLVDATTGFTPSTLTTRWSSNGGSSWTTRTKTTTASGSATDPYLVTISNIPFPSLAAANNKVRFSVTYSGGGTETRDFTVKGKDWAYVNLGSTIAGDGIAHPQPQNGDGDTISATMGGRSCRTTASAADTSFYFHVDDGFCFGGTPNTLYLQVDYYGSAGSITPIYDSRLRTDETLTPVYLNGSSAWRTATWKLEDVNFGNRLPGGADLRLYVGADAGIYISAVRLYENQPSGTLGQAQNAIATALSPTQVSLTWDAVPGATKYQVCRGSTCVGWPTGASFTDSSLTPNTQYKYTVTAYDNSDYTSPTSGYQVATTLSNPPSVTPSRNPMQWGTTSLSLTLDGSFGWGNVGYYRYALDESPVHSWSGDEPSWPAGVDPAQGWSVWRPTVSPTTENGSGWLLYDGSTTQRGISEQLVADGGAPAWRLIDEGRVVNTKTKIACWPTLTISRATGVTMSVRMKAADSPLGWDDSNVNFGLSLPDRAEVGVAVRPDALELADDPVAAPDNGYAYRTYTLTLRDYTYELYRDGQLMASAYVGPSGNSMWSGPFFGHTTSNAVGAWSFQWIAWSQGYHPPSSWNAPLTVAFPHHGTSFYLHLLAFNADGTPSGSVDLGPFYYWNGTTPIAPTVTDDGDYTTSTAIHATYTIAAPSVTRYEYAIGTIPGGQDVVPYTSNGQALELTRAGLSMSVGPTYYVSVRAVAGATGPAGSSDGIRIAPRYDSIGQAKSLADGSPVALYGVTVTAVFGDCIYVQDAAHSAIRVLTDKAVAVGEVVDLAGVMAGAGGERSVIADCVFAAGP